MINFQRCHKCQQTSGNQKGQVRTDSSVRSFSLHLSEGMQRLPVVISCVQCAAGVLGAGFERHLFRERSQNGNFRCVNACRRVGRSKLLAWPIFLTGFLTALNGICTYRCCLLPHFQNAFSQQPHVGSLLERHLHGKSQSTEHRELMRRKLARSPFSGVSSAVKGTGCR